MNVRVTGMGDGYCLTPATRWMKVRSPAMGDGYRLTRATSWMKVRSPAMGYGYRLTHPTSYELDENRVPVGKRWAWGVAEGSLHSC